MTRPRLLVVACCLLCGAAAIGMARAEPVPTGDSSWYYRIGGGNPIFSVGIRVDPGRLSAPRGGLLNARCDFDPGRSATNYLNDFRRNIYGLNRALVAQAGAVLRTSALSVLQRANPGLYDLLSQGLSAARVEFEASVRDCRQLRRVQGGGSLLDGWQRLGRRASWAQAQRDGVDAGAAARAVEEDGGEGGLQWVGGQMAGGQGQPPIALTADLVRAGHQLLRSRQTPPRPVGQGGAPPTALWEAPEPAVAWAVAVLGETELRLCAGCEALATRVGHGLQAEIRAEAERALSQLEPLLADGRRPQASALAALAVPGMGLAINAQVIYALREEAGANRAILAGRLAAEIAIARALEKALTLRQLLRLGRQEPSVASNAEAQRAAGRLLAEVEGEIDNILFEQRVRREALAGTALALLERSGQRANAPLSGVFPAAPPPRLDRFGPRDEPR